jgi:serine/threonine protein kinase
VCVQEGAMAMTILKFKDYENTKQELKNFYWFGDSWKARRRSDNSIALIHRLNLDDQNELQILDTKLKDLPNLEHADIAKIMDYEVNTNHYDLLTEFHGTANLYGKKYSEEEAIKIIITVLEMVDHAHQKKDEKDKKDEKVIHGGICSKAVYIDSAKKVKLAYFGLCEIFLDFEFRKPVADQNAEALKIASPEQLNRTLVSFQSDIYQMGLLTHELVTGEAAFQASSSYELRNLRENNEYKPLPATISTGLKEVIETALQKETSQRYPTASAMKEALEKLLPQEPFSPPPVPITPKQTTGKNWVISQTLALVPNFWRNLKIRNLLLASIAAIIILLSIIGIVIAMNGEKPTPTTPPTAIITPIVTPPPSITPPVTTVPARATTPPVTVPPTVTPLPPDRVEAMRLLELARNSLTIARNNGTVENWKEALARFKDLVGKFQETEAEADEVNKGLTESHCSFSKKIEGTLDEDVEIVLESLEACSNGNRGLFENLQLQRLYDAEINYKEGLKAKAAGDWRNAIIRFEAIRDSYGLAYRDIAKHLFESYQNYAGTLPREPNNAEEIRKNYCEALELAPPDKRAELEQLCKEPSPTPVPNPTPRPTPVPQVPTSTPKVEESPVVSEPPTPTPTPSGILVELTKIPPIVATPTKGF